MAQSMPVDLKKVIQNCQTGLVRCGCGTCGLL